MKYTLIAVLVALLMGCTSVQAVDFRSNGNDQVNPVQSPLRQKQWIHGSADCKSNADPAIEVFQFDQSSYILRQNKCLSYEAPFMYLLFGKKMILLFDTGATESAVDFPLYETVQSLITENRDVTNGAAGQRELIVIHSHNHSDHYTGDSQFAGQQNVTLVEPNRAAMNDFFAFNDWPDNEVYLDLGDRKLTIIPTPGHQEEAISLYDPHTKWLLTGDTIYPGYIYVKNWDEYTKSVARLAEFVQTHEVNTILGAHIEMSNTPGETYPIGTIYQPDESSLALTPENMAALHAALKQADTPGEIIFDEFIVAPMNTVQKTISNVARWFTQ